MAPKRSKKGVTNKIRSVRKTKSSRSLHSLVGSEGKIQKKTSQPSAKVPKKVLINVEKPNNKSDASRTESANVEYCVCCGKLSVPQSFRIESLIGYRCKIKDSLNRFGGIDVNKGRMCTYCLITIKSLKHECDRFYQMCQRTHQRLGWQQNMLEIRGEDNLPTDNNGDEETHLPKDNTGNAHSLDDAVDGSNVTNGAVSIGNTADDIANEPDGCSMDVDHSDEAEDLNNEDLDDDAIVEEENPNVKLTKETVRNFSIKTRGVEKNSSLKDMTGPVIDKPSVSKTKSVNKGTDSISKSPTCTVINASSLGKNTHNGSPPCKLMVSILNKKGPDHAYAECPVSQKRPSVSKAEKVTNKDTSSTSEPPLVSARKSTRTDLQQLLSLVAKAKTSNKDTGSSSKSPTCSVRNVSSVSRNVISKSVLQKMISSVAKAKTVNNCPDSNSMPPSCSAPNASSVCMDTNSGPPPELTKFASSEKNVIVLKVVKNNKKNTNKFVDHDNKDTKPTETVQHLQPTTVSIVSDDKLKDSKSPEKIQQAQTVSDSSSKNVSQSVSKTSEQTVSVCSICGIACFSEVDLKGHFFGRHGSLYNNLTWDYLHCLDDCKSKCEYKCSLCGMRYSVKQEACAHISVGHNIKNPLKCTLCDQSFNEKDAIRTHVLTHYQNRVKPNIRCWLCNAEFKSEKLLAEHPCWIQKAPKASRSFYDRVLKGF